jgi:hypothetical protein
MTSVRRLEDRLRAWTSFRSVARASRNLAAAQSRRWMEHLRHAEAYLLRCSALAREYGELVGAPRRVVLAVGTDLGLCGALNTRVAALARASWAAADLRLAVGRRLGDHLDPTGAVSLPSPTSFEAAESLAAEIEALLAARIGPTAALEIVVTTGVASDGTPRIECSSRAPGAPAEPAGPCVELVPAEVARPVAATLLRHARIMWALCVGASSEADARWRVMHRAHEAADRRIAVQQQELRKRRQELLTQEMLEARQGGAGRLVRPRS